VASGQRLGEHFEVELVPDLDRLTGVLGRPARELLPPDLREGPDLAVGKELLGDDLGFDKTVLLELAEGDVDLADVEDPGAAEELFEGALELVAVSRPFGQQRQEQVLEHTY